LLVSDELDFPIEFLFELPLSASAIVGVTARLILGSAIRYTQDEENKSIENATLPTKNIQL
jgi:hypothetical protein